ncbi:MAG: 2-oxoacid:acceptor oxidoreductase family protein [Deltaproteobacteria bacterium]|nr:2-oxoacid:acceptor oxidoreductase family protein [Deltaproteobacteria bacterium]
MKARTEILASGFGGQGVVRLGQIFGVAGVKQNYRVTMLKSHGTEQRGGYVRAQVVLSTEPIDSPMVEDPDYFCALSSAAYESFSDLVRNGVIFYDPDNVKIDKKKEKEITHFSVAAQDNAVKKLGRPIFANTIMLGAMTKSIEALDKEIVLSTMLSIIPKFKEENKKAFELGYSLVGD